MARFSNSSAKIQPAIGLHRLLFLFAGLLVLAVLGVAGYWTWTRFPLSGDTLSHDQTLSFTYDRTTTRVSVTTVPMRDLFVPTELAASSTSCLIPHDAPYYAAVLNRFPAGAMATVYTMTSIAGHGGWTMTVLDNSLHYSDRAEFSYDFNSCGGGGVGVPERVSPTTIVFGQDCRALSAEISATTCSTISKKILSSLHVN